MSKEQRNAFIKQRKEYYSKNPRPTTNRQLQVQQAVTDYFAKNGIAAANQVPPQIGTMTPLVHDVMTTSLTTAGTAPTGANVVGTGPSLKLLIAKKADVVTEAEDQNQAYSLPVTQGTDSHRYLHVDTAQRQYNVTHAATSTKGGALVDRGANGGMAGSNMKRLETVIGVTADVQGVADLKVRSLDIILGASLVEKTNRGPVIGLFPQYAYYGEGNTIHSALQMEAFGLQVDEKSRRSKYPGRQRITTPDGYVIPLSIRNGLP